jgi:hypothetical protein
MRLSLQAASSSFNCTAYAVQAAGSLNRRWRIIRPYRLNVVCLIMFETGTVGGRAGKDHLLSRAALSCSSTRIVNRSFFVDLTRCFCTINCIYNIVYAAI